MQLELEFFHLRLLSRFTIFSTFMFDCLFLPQVLLADEPTASVDLHADKQIHEVLLGLRSTVLMICHRLHYVHRFDMVILLGCRGKVLEMGTPAALLEQPGSYLSELYRVAGIRDQ